MSMTFATLYPEKVSKIILLEGNTYSFPNNPKLKILRFTALDDESDKDTVPQWGVHHYLLKGARPIDWCDQGSVEIKDEIQKQIIKFLDSKS